MGQVPALVWRKTNVPVTIGYETVIMMINFISPFELLTGDILHQDLTGEARKQCDEAYKSLFLEEMQNICPFETTSTAHVRTERELVTAVVIGVIAVVAFVSAGIAGAAIASNSNAVASLENRENEEKSVIDQLESQIKKNFDNSEDDQGNFNTAMVNLDTLQKDHDEMKGKLVSTTFTIAKLVSKLYVGRETIRAARRLWSDGKVSAALMDFLEIKLPCGNSCPVELSAAQGCSMSPEFDRMNINFLVPIIDHNLTVVEADPFILMKRSGNKTCRLQYSGLLNAIISNATECFYPLESSTPAKYHDLVALPTDGCKSTSVRSESENFVLTKCRPSIEGDYKDFVQVKPYGKNFAVYCPESLIELLDFSGNCPNNVSMVPMTSHFRINGIKYNGVKLSLNHQESIEEFLTAKGNEHVQPTFNWSTLLIDVEKEDGKFNETHLSDFHVASNYYSTMGVGSGTIVLILIILYMCCRRQNTPNVISVIATPASKV